MRGYMFRNRWFAMLFVALVLAGVTRLVGTGKGDGAIDLAKDQIAEQKAQAEALTTGTHAPTKPAVKIEFTPDEELIDQALGEDPTPIDQRIARSETDGEEAVPHDTVILVSQDAAIQPPQAQPEP